jgi:hypothetical protein
MIVYIQKNTKIKHPCLFLATKKVYHAPAHVSINEENTEQISSTKPLEDAAGSWGIWAVAGEKVWRGRRVEGLGDAGVRRAEDAGRGNSLPSMTGTSPRSISVTNMSALTMGPSSAPSG